MGGAFSSSGSSGSAAKKSTTSSKTAGQITEIDRAILDLKNTRDRLTKYNVQLELSIEKLLDRARAAKDQGRTQTALGLLRLKKYKQTQVEQVQTQLLNVHQLIETIDSQQRNTQIVASLKAGKEALAQLHKETTVEDVLQLMDEIQEQHAVEQEITDVINGAVPTLTADQEEAVEAELEALQMELQGDKTQVEQADLILPHAPTDKLPEIKQLQPAKTTTTEQQPERVPIAG